MSKIKKIQAAEEATLRIVDGIVNRLLDDGTEFYSSDVSERWRKIDPTGWHSSKYASAWLHRWLKAAQQRGELASDLRSTEGPKGPSQLRRVYWRPAAEEQMIAMVEECINSLIEYDNDLCAIDPFDFALGWSLGRRIDPGSTHTFATRVRDRIVNVGMCIGDGGKRGERTGCGYTGGQSGYVCPNCGGMLLSRKGIEEAERIKEVLDQCK